MLPDGTAVRAVLEVVWFKVAWADFPGLLHAEIQDPDVLRIAEQWPLGPVDRFRDLLWPAAGRHLLLRLFDQAGDDGHEAST